MITANDLGRIYALLGEQGRADVEWAESLQPPATADDFALEAIYVVCNSGMRFTVARSIYDRVVRLLKLDAFVRKPQRRSS